jgi:tRNA A37 threonylcarbamoyladenosine synthetase subunit TsaC/SUA5/YrdC
VASTIVDVTAEVPRVVRAGALGLDELRSVVPDVVG